MASLNTPINSVKNANTQYYIAFTQKIPYVYYVHMLNQAVTCYFYRTGRTLRAETGHFVGVSGACDGGGLIRLHNCIWACHATSSSSFAAVQ